MLSKESRANRTSPQSRFVAPSTYNAVPKQVRGYAEAKASPTEVSSILEQRIRGISEEASLAETGRVLSVGYIELPAITATLRPAVKPLNKNING